MNAARALVGGPDLGPLFAALVGEAEHDPAIAESRVSVRFAVTTATLGAMTVLLYTAGYFYSWTHRSPGFPTGAWAWLMNATFAPVIAWGPLLITVTVHYCRRRRAARVA